MMNGPGSGQDAHLKGTQGQIIMVIITVRGVMVMKRETFLDALASLGFMLETD